MQMHMQGQARGNRSSTNTVAMAMAMTRESTNNLPPFAQKTPTLLAVACATTATRHGQQQRRRWHVRIRALALALALADAHVSDHPVDFFLRRAHRRVWRTVMCAPMSIDWRTWTWTRTRTRTSNRLLNTPTSFYVASVCRRRPRFQTKTEDSYVSRRRRRSRLACFPIEYMVVVS